MPRLTDLRAESWPIAGGFTISRGTKTESHVVVAEISDNGATGRGECLPYARYGETVDSVLAAIRAYAADHPLDRRMLTTELPPGAARNALDCALWDLEAKATGKSVAELAGLPPLKPVTTAWTLSLAGAEEMGRVAAAAAQRPLLKVKLGGDGDDARIRAVRAGAPGSRLIVDANEAWTADLFDRNMRACREAGVDLVEQPLPADDDGLLAEIDHPVPICADESAHVSGDIEALADRYDAVNIKLDKTGGLTEALALADAARDKGMTIMVGCMIGTSLAMAPAFLVAQQADIVDIDGPLILTEDRDPGLVFHGSIVEPPAPALWG